MISLRKAFLEISHPTTAYDCTLSRPIVLYRRLQPDGKFKTPVLVTALKRVLTLTDSSPVEYVTVDWAHTYRSPLVKIA